MHGFLFVSLNYEKVNKTLPNYSHDLASYCCTILGAAILWINTLTTEYLIVKK